MVDEQRATLALPRPSIPPLVGLREQPSCLPIWVRQTPDQVHLVVHVQTP